MGSKSKSSTQSSKFIGMLFGFRDSATGLVRLLPPFGGGEKYNTFAVDLQGIEQPAEQGLLVCFEIHHDKAKKVRLAFADDLVDIQREKGIVRSFSEAKNIGFIKTSAGEKYVFRVSDLSENVEALYQNSNVRFIPVVNRDGGRFAKFLEHAEPFAEAPNVKQTEAA